MTSAASDSFHRLGDAAYPFSCLELDQSNRSPSLSLGSQWPPNYGEHRLRVSRYRAIPILQTFGGQKEKKGMVKPALLQEEIERDRAVYTDGLKALIFLHTAGEVLHN